MNLAALRDRLLLQEDLNFLLTNRVPRIALTRFMGWFSKIRNPWTCRASIAAAKQRLHAHGTGADDVARRGHGRRQRT